MDAHIGRMDVRVDLNIEDANMIHLAPKYTKVRRKMGGGNSPELLLTGYGTLKKGKSVDQSILTTMVDRHPLNKC